MFFWAVTGNAGWELWTSDGTAAGTLPIVAVAPGIGTSTTTTPIAAGADGAYFSILRYGGAQLWRSDSTAPGTKMLLDDPSLGGVLFASGAKVFAFGRDLWVTDGTPAGTLRLASELQGTPLAVVGGTLYFGAPRCDIPCGIDEYLWRTDGTPSGTFLLKGSKGEDVLAPRSAVAFGDLLVFVAEWGLDEGVWVSDGTPAGTREIRQLGSSNSSSQLELAGQGVFFSAFDPVHGQELWVLRQD